MKEHIVADKAEYYATVDGGNIRGVGQLDPGLHIVSPDTTTVIIATDVIDAQVILIITVNT